MAPQLPDTRLVRATDCDEADIMNLMRRTNARATSATLVAAF